MWRVDFPYGVGKCPHGGQGGGHCVQKDEEIYDYHLRLKAIEYLQVRLTAAKRLVPPPPRACLVFLSGARSLRTLC